MVKSGTDDRSSREQGQPMVADALGAVFEQIRDALPAEEWSGLRQSQLRVLSSVPATGLSLTELADRVRMTKQAAGPFVDALVKAGMLAVGPLPGDRRVRFIRRTSAGDAVVVRLRERFAELEATWATIVGERRYATFRAVLDELGRTGGERPGEELSPA